PNEHHQFVDLPLLVRYAHFMCFNPSIKTAAAVLFAAMTFLAPSSARADAAGDSLDQIQQTVDAANGACAEAVVSLFYGDRNAVPASLDAAAAHAQQVQSMAAAPDTLA